MLADDPKGQPLPHDEERFRRFSNGEAITAMKPGAKFPSPEEMAQQTLERIAKMRARGIDGN